MPALMSGGRAAALLVCGRHSLCCSLGTCFPRPLPQHRCSPWADRPTATSATSRPSGAERT